MRGKPSLRHLIEFLLGIVNEKARHTPRSTIPQTSRKRRKTISRRFLKGSLSQAESRNGSRRSALRQAALRRSVLPKAPARFPRTRARPPFGPVPRPVHTAPAPARTAVPAGRRRTGSERAKTPKASSPSEADSPAPPAGFQSHRPAQSRRKEAASRRFPAPCHPRCSPRRTWGKARRNTVTDRKLLEKPKPRPSGRSICGQKEHACERDCEERAKGRPKRLPSPPGARRYSSSSSSFFHDLPYHILRAHCSCRYTFFPHTPRSVPASASASRR